MLESQPLSVVSGWTRLQSKGMMAERRREMQRKRFGAVLGALAAGFMLSVTGPAQAAIDSVAGYLMGDPSPGKLVPYWAVGGDLATIIGIENTSGQEGPSGPATDPPIEGSAGDIAVHIAIFSNRSGHLVNDTLCLSPFDFGFIILQEPSPSDDQLDGLRPFKSVIFSRDDGDLGSATFGYLSLKVAAKFKSVNGTCTGNAIVFDFAGAFDPEHAAEPMATWAILQDVGDGFFATEIPTPTALVNNDTGQVTGGIGAFGLIPGPSNIVGDPGGVGCTDDNNGNRVIARFDVNEDIGSQTTIFVWLRRNQFNVSGDPAAGCGRRGVNGSSNIAFIDCETEREVSTTLFLPDEVNLVDPANLNGIATCTRNGLFRGVLRFKMPDTGFLWSHISQDAQHYRENFLGYNMDCNWFISDFFEPGTCFGDTHDADGLFRCTSFDGSGTCPGVD
jgi:hypothetical protein